MQGIHFEYFFGNTALKYYLTEFGFGVYINFVSVLILMMTVWPVSIEGKKKAQLVFYIYFFF